MFCKIVVSFHKIIIRFTYIQSPNNYTILAGLSESVVEQLQLVSMVDVVESLVRTGKLTNYPDSASLPAGSSLYNNVANTTTLQEENKII